MRSDSHATGGRPGRRPRFDHLAPVNAALSIGISTFSVAAVSRALGVTTTAIYRRYPSRGDLLEACLDTLLAEVPPLSSTPDAGAADWQTVLRRFGEEWWGLCIRHPGLDTVAVTYTGPPDRFVDVPFRSYLERLRELEVEDHDAKFGMSLLVSALAHSNLRRHSPSVTDSDVTRDKDSVIEFIIRALSYSTPEHSTQ